MILVTLLLLFQTQPPAQSGLQDKLACASVVEKNKKGQLPYSSHDSESDIETTSRWDAKTQTCFEIQTDRIHGTKRDEDGNTYDGLHVFIFDAIEGTKYGTFMSSWKHTPTSATERHAGWGSISKGEDWWDSTGRKDFYLSEFGDRVFKAFGIKL